MKDKIPALAIAVAVLLTAAHAYHRFVQPDEAAASAPAGPLRAVVPRLVGEPAPPVALAGLREEDGGREGVAAGPACRLVYFFDPACGACRASAPSWTGISSITRGGVTARVAWVLLGPDPDAAREFVAEFGIEAPVFTTSEEDPHQAFGVQGVPALWAIRGDTLREVRLGASETVPENIELDWCADAAAG